MAQTRALEQIQKLARQYEVKVEIFERGDSRSGESLLVKASDLELLETLLKEDGYTVAREADHLEVTPAVF
jgi:hypothetical protein